jgi:hypothetical protein
MQQFAASLQPAILDITGGQRVPVPPPSVRAALAVLDGRGARDPAVKAWLPACAIRVLRSQAFSEERSLEVLQGLVVAFSPEPEESADDAESQLHQQNWQARVGEYRSAFGCALQEVLQEPWPIFLRQLRSLRAVQARRQVRSAEWYAAAKTSGDAMDRLLRHASFPSKGGSVPPWEQAGVSRQDWLDRKLAEAHSVRSTWTN